MGVGVAAGKRTVAWMVLGSFFVFLEMPAVLYVRGYYLKYQPYFSSPIHLLGSRIPLRNDAYGKGYFGASRNGGRKHKGIDILAPMGSQITAPKSGRVTLAVEEKGYGKWIEVLHADGLVSRYAHLSVIRVSSGDWVSKGQIIGLSGKSGNATNPHIKPHLHFEIRYRSQPLNPTLGLLEPGLSLS